MFGGVVCRRLVGAPPRAVDLANVLVRGAAPVALVSGLVWLIASIAEMTGDPAGVLDPQTLNVFFFQTPFGPNAILRIGLMGLLCLAAVLPGLRRVRPALMGAASGALLVSQAWLGHAAESGATPYGTLMIAAYACHVLAGALWVGGLPVLVATLIASRRASPLPEDARVLHRYSVLATAAVATIVMTGIANTVFHAGLDLHALWSSGYGQILAVKLLFVAGMLACAVRNRFILMPRLERFAATPAAVNALIRSIEIEIGLGLLVLGAAAILGVTSPPR